MTKAYQIMAPVLSIVLVVALGAVIMLVGSHAEAPIGVSVGTSRALSPDFMGFNNGQQQPNIWTSPSFVTAVDQLAPETIRGPAGGNPSDNWNWQTGQYFTTSMDSETQGFKPGAPNPPFTLADYINGLKAVHADSVFNLNFMTYCPTDESNPASTDQAAAGCTQAQACGPNPSEYTTECTNTDYTWGLDYQIAMLKAAQSMGIPIKYIELGNEIYIRNDPDYVYYFPSSQTYVDKANAWIPVLKQDFPGAQIAVVGDASASCELHPGQTQLGNQLAWNQAINSGVHGEDAITYHTYYSSDIPSGGSVDNPQDLATMLSIAPQSCFDHVAEQVLPQMPSGVSAWMTEWNLTNDDTVLEHGSWAQGLTEATFALDLARQPQIELADNHSLIANQAWGALFNATNAYVTNLEGQPFTTPTPLPTTQVFGMSAGGFALSSLQRSLRGATGTAALNFSNNPPIAGSSVPGLVGQSFTVNGQTNLYFVNMSDQTETLSLGSLAGYYSVLQYASSPINFVTGDASIPAINSIATDTVTLPAYSVTSLVSTSPPPSSPSTSSGTTITTPSTPASQTNTSAKHVTLKNTSAPNATSTKAYVDGKLVGSGSGNQVSIDSQNLPAVPNGQQTVTLKSSNPGGSISIDGQTIAVHNTFAKQIIASYQTNKWLTVGSVTAIIILVVAMYVFGGFKRIFNIIKRLAYRLRNHPPTDQGSPPPIIITPTQPQ